MMGLPGGEKKLWGYV